MANLKHCTNAVRLPDEGKEAKILVRSFFWPSVVNIAHCVHHCEKDTLLLRALHCPDDLQH